MDVDQDALVSQFCDITGAPPNTVSRWLSLAINSSFIFHPININGAEAEAEECGGCH